MSKTQIQLERERTLRVETHLKRAVKIATHFKDSHDKLKEENEALKKEVASLTRLTKTKQRGSHNFDENRLKASLESLDEIERTTFRNLLRKSIHPDKHNHLSTSARNALGIIFSIIERCFE